jgi:uroporphyrinogen decarboxylase
MDKRERVRAALDGQSVDRPPYGFWTHMPGIDLDCERIAAATAAFQARYDLDFVKSMPNGFYSVEDWGAELDFSRIASGGTGRVVKAPVTGVDDWQRLGRLDVLAGAHGRELEHLQRLVALVGPDVPVLATVFSPLTTASKLSLEAHRAHLAQDAVRVMAGLEVIAEATCAFVRAAIARGCAGMFFALQEATQSAFSAADYARFGAPYDTRVLAAAKEAGGWFNVLHMHGDDVLFELLQDYDVTALNWHIGETPPSIGEYRRQGGTRPIVGGLQRANLTRADRPAIRNDIERTLQESGGRGILIAPACVIRHPVDEATLRWTAETIRGYDGASLR